MNQWSCNEFESALSDYREDRLTPAQAAVAAEHLLRCEACALLLEGVNLTVAEIGALPTLALPEGFEQAVYARTRRPRLRPEFRWLAALTHPRAAMPRLALALALMVFTVGAVLDAAQVNLRHVQWTQITPASLSAALQGDLERTLARGVSFYNDLRVVYEIQAALHQMRHDSNPPAPGGRSRRDGPGVPAGTALATAQLAIPPQEGNPA